MCRICFEGADQVDADVLIAPCDCSGSQRWVHRLCLERWQRQILLSNGRAERCNVCTGIYGTSVPIIEVPTLEPGLLLVATAGRMSGTFVRAVVLLCQAELLIVILTQ